MMISTLDTRPLITIFFVAKMGQTLIDCLQKKAVAFHPNTSYKIQFKILGGNEYGIKIGYPKIYEWAKNTYNEEFWREVPL
jgi:hypothetical protein